MSNLFRRVTLAAALLLALPALAVAQDATPGLEHEHTDAEHSAHQQELQALTTEIQQLHQKLAGIQQDALADPELNAAQEELGEEIRAAMGEVDPTVDAQVARIAELDSQIAEAQQTGNAETAQQLIGEAQQIQQRMMTLQGQILERPHIAAKVSDFQDQIKNKMIELDPSAEALITRFRELETQLMAAMASGA